MKADRPMISSTFWRSFAEEQPRGEEVVFVAWIDPVGGHVAYVDVAFVTDIPEWPLGERPTDWAYVPIKMETCRVVPQAIVRRGLPTGRGSSKAELDAVKAEEAKDGR